MKVPLAFGNYSFEFCAIVWVFIALPYILYIIIFISSAFYGQNIQLLSEPVNNYFRKIRCILFLSKSQLILHILSDRIAGVIEHYAHNIG